MGTQTEDDVTDGTVGTDAAELQRYGGIRLENGHVIIYDTENRNAWMQSGSAVDLEGVA